MANQKHQPPLSQHERIERLTQSREHWRKRARAAEKRANESDQRTEHVQQALLSENPELTRGLRFKVGLKEGDQRIDPRNSFHIDGNTLKWGAPRPDEATDTLAADIRRLSNELATTRGQLALWQFFGYSMSALAVLASCAWIYERFAT